MTPMQLNPTSECLFVLGMIGMFVAVVIGMAILVGMDTMMEGWEE